MKKETQTIEFKQSWRDEYLDWICGYVNAGVFACGIFFWGGVVNGDVAIVGNVGSHVGCRCGANVRKNFPFV